MLKIVADTFELLKQYAEKKNELDKLQNEFDAAKKAGLLTKKQIKKMEDFIDEKEKELGRYYGRANRSLELCFNTINMGYQDLGRVIKDEKFRDFFLKELNKKYGKNFYFQEIELNEPVVLLTWESGGFDEKESFYTFPIFVTEGLVLEDRKLKMQDLINLHNEHKIYFYNRFREIEPEHCTRLDYGDKVEIVDLYNSYLVKDFPNFPKYYAEVVNEMAIKNFKSRLKHLNKVKPGIIRGMEERIKKMMQEITNYKQRCEQELLDIDKMIASYTDMLNDVVDDNSDEFTE